MVWPAPLPSRQAATDGRHVQRRIGPTHGTFRPPWAGIAAGDFALWIGSRIHGGAAMLRIDVDALISRPLGEVWDFFIDFSNTPHWTRSGSEIRQISDGPLGVGTRVESVRRVLGRDIRSQTM